MSDLKAVDIQQILLFTHWKLWSWAYWNSNQNRKILGDSISVIMTYTYYSNNDDENAYNNVANICARTVVCREYRNASPDIMANIRCKVFKRGPIINHTIKIPKTNLKAYFKYMYKRRGSEREREWDRFIHLYRNLQRNK